MSKTVRQALIDEVHYPIPAGYVDNIIIKRGLAGESEFSKGIAESNE